MELTITLRKTVADEAEARQLSDAVRNKLAEYPDVNIISYCTQKFEEPEE